MKTMRLKRWMRGLAVAAASIVTVAATGWICLPKPKLLDELTFSHEVYDRNHNLLRITLTADEKYRICTPLDQISPELIQATLLHEDRYYREHPGINPISVARSAWNLLFSGRIHAGASTITMQLARMRYHLYTRSIRGKLEQMLLALEIERHYTKSQILEAYFNLAPYGGNIEGIGAASEIYFGKSPLKLTLPESVALSVIPQSPARRALHRDADNNSLNAAQGRLFDQMAPSTDGRDFRARAESERKFLAPHFTTGVLEQLPAQEQITTTLDLDLQRMLEGRINGYVASNKQLGIKNAAAMLVDSDTMEVLAQVGSANFYDEKIDGQIDGTTSKRSPGSTLKPFVYALGIDQGLILPLSILKDTPRSFGSYNPENYDREFVGPIRAEDALARSRNIPAVDLTSRLSHPTLYEFLKSAGVDLPRDEKFYGLSLPLGGAEVTMQDLVRMYCMLANNGKLRPLNHTRPHSDDPGVRLLSPEACFLTLEMLSKVPRPSQGGEDADMPVFWKTGTSNGFRDAWSVSVFDHYVLAVWVGNFDGSGNPAFIGRTCAGPLLFQIIDAMRASGIARITPHEPPPGANLKRAEFCAVSGQLATPACKDRVTGWFIPGISPITTCEVHREVLVDDATGLRVAADDGTRKVHREVYEFWPSDLLDLFQKAGLPRRLPPPFLPGSNIDESARSGKPPSIVSPKSNVIYSIRASDDASRVLTLRADAEADVRKIYWFVDQAYLGSTTAHESLDWRPQVGTHNIIALDDSGRSSSCAVTVESSNVN
jgi:penicillin-binding protein 1C